MVQSGGRAQIMFPLQREREQPVVRHLVAGWRQRLLQPPPQEFSVRMITIIARGDNKHSKMDHQFPPEVLPMDGTTATMDGIIPTPGLRAGGITTIIPTLLSEASKEPVRSIAVDHVAVPLLAQVLTAVQEEETN